MKQGPHNGARDERTPQIAQLFYRRGLNNSHHVGPIFLIWLEDHIPQVYLKLILGNDLGLGMSPL